MPRPMPRREPVTNAIFFISLSSLLLALHVALVDGQVGLVADDAACGRAGAHQLGTLAARDAALVRLHGALGEDVVRELRVSECLAAKACDGAHAGFQLACCKVGGELAQIAQAGRDDLELRVGTLDLADTVRHAGNAFERMLLRHIRAAVIRAVNVRVEVRVADGNVQQLHAHLPVQDTHQLERLGQVDLGALALAHTPAIRMREAVIHVQAGGDDEIAAGGRLCRCNAAAKQTGAVLERAAEVALTVVCGEQLAVEVAVAALDVHAVKARLLGQRGRYAELVDQAVQILVGQDAVGCDRPVALEDWVVVRDKRRRHALRLGVAAGMGRLHDDDGLEAVLPEAGLLHIVNEPLVVVQIVPGQPELARVCAALRRDGYGLGPDQARARAGKAVVAAQGQLSRTAVRRAVAALHRLDGDAVVHGLGTELDLALQRLEAVGQRQPDTDAGQFLLQLVHGLIVKSLVLHWWISFLFIFCLLLSYRKFLLHSHTKKRYNM